MESASVAPTAGRYLPTLPAARAMTRCECAGVAFEAVARRMETEGLSLAEAMRALNVGLTCTACGPDLTSFLKSRARS